MLRSNEGSESEEESENQDYSETPLINHNSVHDRYYLVQLTFLLMGIGTLTPWNFFITAKDYWMYKFRDTHSNITTNESSMTVLQTKFESYLELANNLPFLLMLALNVQIVDSIPEKIRNILSQLVLILMFFITALFVPINTDEWQFEFLVMTLSMMAVMSCACGMYQGAVVGMASSFPSRYICAVVNGQAVSGVFASALLIFCIIGDIAPQYSSLIYFLCAFTFLVVTFVMYLFVRRKSYFQFHVQDVPRNSHTLLSTNSEHRVQTDIHQILKLTWVYGLSVAMVFWVTLSVYPAVTTLVVSSHKVHHALWASKFFLPTVCFLFFNVADLFGRLFATKFPMPLSKKMLLFTLSVARIALVPLILVCNIQSHYHIPILFSSDVIYAVLVIILGFSNGYIFNVSMMCAPKLVDGPLKEKTGIAMISFMGLGLCFGSLTSYILVQLN